VFLNDIYHGRNMQSENVLVTLFDYMTNTHLPPVVVQ